MKYIYILFLTTITAINSVHPAEEVKTNNRIKEIGRGFHKLVHDCATEEEFEEMDAFFSRHNDLLDTFTANQWVAALSFKIDEKDAITVGQLAQSRLCKAYAHKLHGMLKTVTFVVNDLGAGDLTGKELFQNDTLFTQIA